VTLVAAALTAVGITMYDDGSLSAHLTAIFIAVVVITGVVSLLALPSPALRPSRGERGRRPQAGSGCY